MEIIAICFDEVEFIGFKPLVDYAKSDSRVGLKPEYVHRVIGKTRYSSNI